MIAVFRARELKLRPMDVGATASRLAQALSRCLAYGLPHIAWAKTVENRHGARHGKLARPRVVGLGHSLHHVAVLHARKDMQLHISLSCCQGAISAQHVVWSAVVPIAP